MVLQLQYSRKQTGVILHPTWYDEATASVFSALLGIGVTELQGGLAHTTVQVHPRGIVPGAEVIGLSTFDICRGYMRQ